jgi:beta propeller repeat protein
MKLKLTTTLVALAFVIVSSGFLYAGSTVTQVTDNAYEDSLPQIKGDYVVWQGRVDADWEIFVYNISSGVTTQVTDNGDDDVSPRTDGSHVVWLGPGGSGGEIFVYDIANGITIQVTYDDRIDSPPQIADGLVVWASQVVTDSVEPGEIFLYDIAAGATQQLTTDTLDDSGPQISSETITWVQTDADDNSTLFTYDIATGITAEAPEGFVWEDSPQVDGKLTTLIRHDGEDREVFLLNRDSRRYHQVSDNHLQDEYPSISGTYIAWMAAGEIFVAEYEYLGLLNPTQNAQLPRSTPPPFVWEGIGYDEFKVTFSGDPTFAALSASAFPSGEGSWTSQTSFSPTEEQWKDIVEMQEGNGTVYWRVAGRDAERGVSFTEARNFTIDPLGPSAQMAVEADAEDRTVSGGKSCFIDTTLTWD